MKDYLLKYIVCPLCGTDLKLITPVSKNGEITNASLICQENHSFPVTNGVPRLLSQEQLSETQKQTQSSFSEKWQRASDVGYNAEVLEFLRNWYLQRYGWGDQDRIKQFLSYLLNN